jgi:tetratricopeptide (TPR) repeat protein
MISYNGFDLFFMVCYSFMFYFFKLFLPVSLCGIYVYPPKTDGMLPWEYYASPAFFLLVLFLLYRFRKNRAVIFGAAIFFITISINIQVIPSRLFITTDRYAYFPYIGLFFIAGYFYNAIKEGQIKTKENAGTIFLSTLGAFSLFFAYSIPERNKTWEDDFVFMTDIIEKNARVPYVSRAYGNRGNYYLSNNMPNEAIADFREAIAIKPDDAQSYYNLAISLTRINDFQNALIYLDSAKKYNPNGALIYSNIGFVKFSLKDLEGALAACNKCISLDSNIAEAYNIRAAIHFTKREYPDCEHDLNKAIALKPDFADALTNRGLLYVSTDRKAKACDDFRQAAALGSPKANDLINSNCK